MQPPSIIPIQSIQAVAGTVAGTAAAICVYVSVSIAADFGKKAPNYSHWMSSSIQEAVPCLTGALSCILLTT